MMIARARPQDLQVSLLARNGLRGEPVRVAGVRLTDRKQKARLVAGQSASEPDIHPIGLSVPRGS